MIGTIVKEFGVGWLFYRALYSAKLRLLRKIPASEKIFEHKVYDIKTFELLPDNIELIENFVKSLPDNEKQLLIRTADNACVGTIIGFSSLEMSYGMPIDWQLNPITGKSCNGSAKWYQIPDFDKERGDIKAVWEISRFSHFVVFARAYLVSDDRKYYEAFASQLKAWLDENPYSYGANFKCGQECALRMMNALLAYNVFYSKGLTDAEDEKNLAELISRCYRKILSNFFYAHKCIKNNHTISELAGMIIGAFCVGDTKRLERAYKLLDKVVLDQFFEDGGYTQYSFNYQRLALQVLEYVLCISEKTGKSLSKEAVNRIKSSVVLLYQCLDKTGDVPNYGFNDGALVFPISSSGYRDFRPIISSLYGRLFEKRLFDGGLYDEEALWFGVIPEKLPSVSEEQRSTAFHQAGLYTLRNDDFWLMSVLNDYKKRPAHMDQLHIDMWVNGVNVLCDCGTYSYADTKGESLALTEAHNTVKFADVEQMSKKSAFLVYNRTVRCSFSLSEKKFAGKVRSKNGYSHERHIIETQNGYIIRDFLISEETKEFELVLHTPCKVVCDGKQIRLLLENGYALSIKGTLDYEIRRGIRSVYYLSEEPVSLISFKGKIQNGKAESEIKLEVLKTEEEHI